MADTIALYLKSEQNVTGPISLGRIRQMAQEGEINSQTSLSLDGNTWRLASQIQGILAGPAVPAQPASGRKRLASTPSLQRLRDLLFRVQKSLRWLPLAFHVAVSSAVLFSLFASFIATYRALAWEFPDTTHLMLAAVSFIPAILLAAAAGQLAGNFALCGLTGLQEDDRRCLSIHMPWSRAPQHWPAYLRNWLYNRDWLQEEQDDSSAPYIRAFVTGASAPDLAEELALWQDLLQPAQRSGRRLEVGRSVWEMSWMETLPAWTRELESATTLPELERRLGAAARKWALCLLHRAASRLPEFVPADFGQDLDRAAFEFFYAPLRNGREGLLVILHPRLASAAAAPVAPVAAPSSDRLPATQAA
jgi:hypothetical protein